MKASHPDSPNHARSLHWSRDYQRRFRRTAKGRAAHRFYDRLWEARSTHDTEWEKALLAAKDAAGGKAELVDTNGIMAIIKRGKYARPEPERFREKLAAKVRECRRAGVDPFTVLSAREAAAVRAQRAKNCGKYTGKARHKALANGRKYRRTSPHYAAMKRFDNTMQCAKRFGDHVLVAALRAAATAAGRTHKVDVDAVQRSLGRKPMDGRRYWRTDGKRTRGSNTTGLPAQEA